MKSPCFANIKPIQVDTELTSINSLAASGHLGSWPCHGRMGSEVTWNCSTGPVLLYCCTTGPQDEMIFANSVTESLSIYYTLIQHNLYTAITRHSFSGWTLKICWGLQMLIRIVMIPFLVYQGCHSKTFRWVSIEHTLTFTDMYANIILRVGFVSARRNSNLIICAMQRNLFKT